MASKVKSKNTSKQLETKHLQQLVGVKQLAEILSVSVRSLQRWDRDGHLPPAIRIGPKSHRRWKIADIETFLLSRKGGK